jgi:hypothetical protein
MAIAQPIGTDKLNSPDHSALHRIISADTTAAVKAIAVDASNNVYIGDGGTTNYAKFTSTGNLSFAGTAGISVPYLMQSDNTDQAIANIANTQVITFDTNVHASDITRTSTSRFTIIDAGVYLISFSGVTSGVINEAIEVWLRVDGVDVADSNTRYTFKSNGANAVIAVTFIQEFTAGQYFEFWTWGSATSSKWEYTAAGTSPTRPATPSIIMTCNWLSH